MSAYTRGGQTDRYRYRYRDRQNSVRVSQVPYACKTISVLSEITKNNFVFVGSIYPIAITIISLGYKNFSYPSIANPFFIDQTQRFSGTDECHLSPWTISLLIVSEFVSPPNSPSPLGTRQRICYYKQIRKIGRIVERCCLNCCFSHSLDFVLRLTASARFPGR